MVEVLISVTRPASMSESEMRGWVSGRSQGGGCALSLSSRGGMGNHALLLRANVRAGTGGTAEHQLTELMLDMRLLGMRPTIVTRRG